MGEEELKTVSQLDPGALFSNTGSTVIRNSWRESSTNTLGNHMPSCLSETPFLWSLPEEFPLFLEELI